MQRNKFIAESVNLHVSKPRNNLFSSDETTIDAVTASPTPIWDADRQGMDENERETEEITLIGWVERQLGASFPSLDHLPGDRPPSSKYVTSYFRLYPGNLTLNHR